MNYCFFADITVLLGWEGGILETTGKEAEKLAELAQKKEVKEPQSTGEILGKNVQEMNADSENIETSEIQAPSENGV